MNSYGASPGEGPRRGWHGNEEWGTQATSQRWQSFAREAGVRDVNGWMTTSRPPWLDKKDGEEQHMRDAKKLKKKDVEKAEKRNAKESRGGE